LQIIYTQHGGEEEEKSKRQRGMWLDINEGGSNKRKMK
jgi:hypothetical protein